MRSQIGTGKLVFAHVSAFVLRIGFFHFLENAVIDFAMSQMLFHHIKPLAQGFGTFASLHLFRAFPEFIALCPDGNKALDVLGELLGFSQFLGAIARTDKTPVLIDQSEPRDAANRGRAIFVFRRQRLCGFIRIFHLVPAKQNHVLG